MKHYIILVLLVILTFSISLQNSFVWDDYELIVDNPNISLPLKEIPSVFIMPLSKFASFSKHQQGYYRPLVMTLYILNYKIWGLNPLGFHLTNIIFHIFCVIVLYKVGLILFSDKNRELLSLMAASIFAVHPVNSEVIGRTAPGEVMLGFFLILSLYFFLKESTSLSLFTFFLALMSKESAVMFPFALLILSSHKKGVKKGAIALIPYIALTVAYFIFRGRVVDNFLGVEAPKAIFTRVITMAATTLDYIRLLVIPYPLEPFYAARWYTSITEPKVMLAILTLMLTSLLAFKIRKDRVMLFLLALIFFMLAPVIWKVNTFPCGYFDLAAIAVRFLYFPAMSFALLVSALFINIFKDKTKMYAVIGWISVVIIFAVITAHSSIIWKNEFTLFKKILGKSPDSSFAHVGLGDAYKKMGRIDDAMAEWQRAIELNPYNTGNALAEWQKAVDTNPSDSHSYNSIGNVYLLRGDYEKAIHLYKMALKADIHNVETYYNLAISLEKTGKSEEAAVYYKKFMRIAPDKYKYIVSELKKKGL